MSKIESFIEEIINSEEFQKENKDNTVEYQESLACSILESYLEFDYKTLRDIVTVNENEEIKKQKEDYCELLKAFYEWKEKRYPFKKLHLKWP